MEIILGILGFFIIGGVVLRFSRACKISVWKGALCIIVWIFGSILMLAETRNPLYLLLIAVLPFIIIFGLKILGRFIKWALGGWSSGNNEE